MTQGYLLYAQGYAHKKYALACAKSIRDSGDTRPISLVTDKKQSTDIEVFEYVIEIEKNTDKFHVTNRSKLIEFSPYDETTVIESDCLVTQNLESWWTNNKHKELSFISQAYSYRQEKLDTSYDRKTWKANDLPNLYVACHYFKKTNFVKEFFELVKMINSSEEFYKLHLPNRSPKVPSMDIAVCLATKLMDCADKVSYRGIDPMFVHMKPYSQGFAQPEEYWSHKVGFYKENNEIFIGNFKQKGIVHYIEDII